MIDDNVDENAEEDMEDMLFFFFFYKNTSEPFEDHQIFTNSRYAARNRKFCLSSPYIQR